MIILTTVKGSFKSIIKIMLCHSASLIVTSEVTINEKSLGS